MLRHTAHYRHDVFEAAARRMGYRTINQPIRNPGPEDLLILWNRMRTFEPVIARYREAGAPVIIAENGYLPRGKTKQFALSLNSHNGAGICPIGSQPRFEIPMRDWRPDGDRIVLLLQRGIGQQGVAMPSSWPKTIAGKLKRMTGRPIVVRRHPCGRDNPLEPSLKGAWAAITWASGAGCKAIVAGVPVFHEMPRWIGADAALELDKAKIENPYLGERGEFMRRISWAQWSIDEIQSGEAFEAVLSCQA